MRQRTDQVARQILAETGIPSASVAIVQEGRLVYLQAYGKARLDPKTPAQPAMRYSIGSISKQFTAAAVLMLAERGKLSLDDTVAKFLPGLTRGHEITLRQLLSHTSGYRDYWPQDYVTPRMLQPVSVQEIFATWARDSLDFEPGTKWEYSNTNYVIAGRIVEQVSGMTLFDFLRLNIFQPLDMLGAYNVDSASLPPTDAAGYQRFALGPPRLAPQMGTGWMFAACELALSAADLAKWDISLIHQSLMKPSSYQQMETAVSLTNGESSGYGLGIFVTWHNGHLTLEHGGEVSGFTAENIVLPEQHAAVVVLTNQDNAAAATRLARWIAGLLLETADPEMARKAHQAQIIFESLQRGRIDRFQLTSNANAYFSEQALADYASSLAPLGVPESFTQTEREQRGGMTYRAFQATFGEKNLLITTYETPAGKIDQFLVTAQ